MKSPVINSKVHLIGVGNRYRAVIRLPFYAH